MSEFPVYGALNPGPSTADPEALARMVRTHKVSDALAQIVLSLVLMAAICTVAFVLTLDRAAAADLAWNIASPSTSPSFTIALVIGFGVAAMIAAIFAGHRLNENRVARLRLAPVRVRRRF